MADTDDISHLDFEAPKLQATDYIQPCAEGDACPLAVPVVLANTVLQKAMTIRQDVTQLVSIIGRHGSPDAANTLYENWQPFYETVGNYLLKLAQELEDGLGS